MNKNLLIGFAVILTFFVGVMTLFFVWNQKKQSNKEVTFANVNEQISVKEGNEIQEEKSKEERKILSQEERSEKESAIKDEQNDELSFFEISEQQIEEGNVFVNTAVHPVRVYIFYSETCPHCRRENEFFSKLEKELSFLEVEKFEISNDSDMVTQEVFNKLSKDHSTSGSIPLTVIGTDATLGFDDENDEIGMDLKLQIKNCAINGCESWLDDKYGLDGTLKQDVIKVSTQQIESILGK